MRDEVSTLYKLQIEQLQSIQKLDVAEDVNNLIHSLIEYKQNRLDNTKLHNHTQASSPDRPSSNMFVYFPSLDDIKASNLNEVTIVKKIHETEEAWYQRLKEYQQQNQNDDLDDTEIRKQQQLIDTLDRMLKTNQMQSLPKM